MTDRLSISAALVLTIASAASAQVPAENLTMTVEVDLTTGYSSERVGTAAAQARVFGETAGGLRFYVDATWSKLEGDESDVFGSAYPYAESPKAMEAYAERTFRPKGFLAGVRVGRYRTPFGIYGRSDHAYTGFLRAPLIRYGDYFALSNHSLEGGLDVVAGRPDVNLEVSLGVPQDPTDTRRQDGLGWVTRAQLFRGPLIVGASHIRTRPARTNLFARGDTAFTGLDLRWMYRGVALRGEWITGRPFDGTTTRGWYLDGSVHEPFMGPVTAVVRAEHLDYEAGRFSFFPRRVTTGARVVVSRSIVAHVNLVRQHGLPISDRRTVLDLALTYSVRVGLWQ